VGPIPSRKKMPILIVNRTKDKTNAIKSPRIILMNPELLLLNLHTRGIVIKGVKNIANHNISPIVSIYILRRKLAELFLLHTAKL
jgi:hypothetical protein